MTDSSSGMPRLIWAERSNAHLYAACILLGVPLMAVFMPETWKWLAATLWFGLTTPAYLFLEGREIRGQMTGRGSLDSIQATGQIRTGQLLFWGTIGAVIVWLVGLVIYMVLHWSDFVWWQKPALAWHSLFGTPIKYGLAEWAILAHTVYVGRVSTVTFDGIISEFLKATPRAERAERSIPR